MILERGTVVYEGASAELAGDRATLEQYLGIAATPGAGRGARRH